MEREWRKIPSFENYEVSDFGEVRNNKGMPIKALLNGRPGNQYLKVYLQSPDLSLGGWKARRRTLSIHRLVLLAFYGLPERGQIGCHKNDVKTDNRLENLYWGTHKDNARDSMRLGTFHMPSPGYGENHHSVKYSDAVIAEVRSKYTGKRGEQTAMAKIYNMPQQYLSAILKNKIRVGG